MGLSWIFQASAALGSERLTGCDLYVTLEPCTMCAGALVHARIQRLVFGAAEPKAGAVGSASNLLEAPWINHRPVWRGGVLADICSARISRFFQERRAQRRQERGPPLG